MSYVEHLQLHHLYLRAARRNQMPLTITDEVGPAHTLERRAQHRPIVSVVVTQKRFVQTTLARPSNWNIRGVMVDSLEWILPRPVHRCCSCHRTRQKRLDPVRSIAIGLQPEGKVEHILVGRARMRGDEIRNQILLFARGLRASIK